MKRIVVIWPAAAALALALTATGAGAKLPPPTEEAKAKAAETAARNAWNDKVGAYKLCLAMDRVAAAYAAEVRKTGKEFKPTTTPPCTDPGPFAYTPPAQKPLETSGAHSPAATAAAPPSNKDPQAEQKPASAARP